jgi:hypothetical protein
MVLVRSGKVRSAEVMSGQVSCGLFR